MPRPTWTNLKFRAKGNMLANFYDISNIRVIQESFEV